MAETTPSNSPNGAQLDPLADVHSPEFWDHSLGYLDRDLARMDALIGTLQPTSPEAIVVRELGGTLLAMIRHQERVLLQLAQDTAPKQKRVYTRKAKAIEESSGE